MYNSTQYNTYYHEISNGHECCPPPSTLSSPYNTSTYLSRTSSNLSLQNSIYHQQQQLEQTHNFYDQKDEIYDLHGGGQVRRVFSTEDTIDPYASDNSHNPFETVLSSGSSSPSSVMGRVGRYSAEERKERIERYRSKRIHRNFQKKITYECRKILADSRPRVRGRFARNGEPEMETEAEATSNGWCGWTEEEEKGMNTSMKSTSSSTMGTTGEGYSYDSELWPSFVGNCFTFSNLISLD